MKPKKPLKCSICGENADGSHFGANACRACAAFYRRTIAKNLRYICRFNNDCEISQSHRCMCRSCRLVKCERVGMKREAVQQSRVSGMTSRYDAKVDVPKESATISQKLKSLQAIIEKSKKTIILDPSTLPPYPNLAKMMFGYEELQRLRDLHFCRSHDVAGVSTRTFREKEFLDIVVYVEMMYAEVNHVAEMLNFFHGFNDLPLTDKLILFKEFWIHFTILERCFDTYRVLGHDPNDTRLIFSDGSIINVMMEDRIKVEHVTDAGVVKTEQLYTLLRPWFKLAVELLCPPVKELQPTSIEMLFCYGIMFYGCEDHLSPLYSDTRTSELSPSTLQFMREMTNILYEELNAYYQTEAMPSNIVHRVSELMRFISKTERMVWHRKEDILITETFNVFKIDIYLENLFNEQ